VTWGGSATRRARGDLLDLWAYLAPKDPAAADRIYDGIEESCRLLRDHPRLGPARPEIARSNVKSRSCSAVTAARLPLWMTGCMTQFQICFG